MYSSSLKDQYTGSADNTQEASEGVMRTINRTASKVADSISSATDKVSRATGNTKQQIRNNPVQSSLIAFGVGFFIAKLISW